MVLYKKGSMSERGSKNITLVREVQEPIEVPFFVETQPIPLPEPTVIYDRSPGALPTIYQDFKKGRITREELQSGGRKV